MHTGLLSGSRNLLKGVGGGPVTFILGPQNGEGGGVTLSFLDELIEHFKYKLLQVLQKWTKALHIVFKTPLTAEPTLNCSGYVPLV